MQTTTQTATKTFYAHLMGHAGLLGKVHGAIYFLRYEDGEVVEYEPTMALHLTVLGEAGVADAQQIQDRVRGGYAAVACSRAN